VKHECPCHGCLDRTLTCHHVGQCQKWEDWKKYEADKKEWEKQQKPIVSEAMVKKAYDNIKRKARGWRQRAGGNHDG
jgi:hypothetical protein